MDDIDQNQKPLLDELTAARECIARLEERVQEWKSTADRLRESGESFRRIFEHSNDAIFVMDMDRERILDVNLRACEMLGYRKEELLSLPMAALHPDEMTRLRMFAGSVVREGAGWSDELTYLTRFGKKVPAEVSASLMKVSGATCMIAMVRDISVRKNTEEKLRVAYERMRKDLDAAVRIQKSLLPNVCPAVEGVRFAWELHACENLAGDILNIFQLDPEHVAFYLLDVSGHGAAAAMMSMTLHRALSPPPGPTSVLVRQQEGTDPVIRSPGEVCEDLNILFPMETDTPQYFTLMYGFLNARTRLFRYASAGHCPPVYLPAKGEASELLSSGPPVGLLPSARYQEHRMTMEPGSRLYLYSDGLTDAFNGDSETFGRDRLLAAIEESRPQSLRESVTALLGRMRDWSGSSHLQDDVSLLAVETDH